MFKNRDELLEYLLSNDFVDKYSEAEYRYFLLAFRENYRELSSLYEQEQDKAKARDKEIQRLDKVIKEMQKANENLSKVNRRLRGEITKHQKKTWIGRIFTSFDFD
jgi:hypothetical protein